MAAKHPSSRSVALTIIAVIAVCAATAYGLGVMNMKKESPTEEQAKEEKKDEAAPAATTQATPAQADPATPADPAKAPAAGIDKALLNIRPDDIVIGKPEAPVTIVEYSSLSCPHCAHFHNNELPKLQQQYLDTGKAKLVLRHFPLNAPALKAALLVNCAPASERTKFIKVLFEMQPQWAYTESYQANLKQIAAVGGVSSDSFDACMANKPKEDAIVSSVDEASKKLGVDATPTFFVGGTKLNEAPDAEHLGKAIDAAQPK